MLAGMLFNDKDILKGFLMFFVHPNPILIIDQISRFYTDIMIGNAYYPPIDLHLGWVLKNQVS